MSLEAKARALEDTKRALEDSKILGAERAARVAVLEQQLARDKGTDEHAQEQSEKNARLVPLRGTESKPLSDKGSAFWAMTHYHAHIVIGGISSDTYTFDDFRRVLRTSALTVLTCPSTLLFALSQGLCAPSQVSRVAELEAQERRHADAQALQVQEVARLTAALEEERRKVREACRIVDLSLFC